MYKVAIINKFIYAGVPGQGTGAHGLNLAYYHTHSFTYFLWRSVLESLKFSSQFLDVIVCTDIGSQNELNIFSSQSTNHHKLFLMWEMLRDNFGSCP